MRKRRRPYKRRCELTQIRVFVSLGIVATVLAFLWLAAVERKQGELQPRGKNVREFKEKQIALEAGQESSEGLVINVAHDEEFLRRQTNIWKGRGFSPGKPSAQGDTKTLKIVLVVPYRNRAVNWDVFLKYMSGFLTMGVNAGGEFHVIRVEQVDMKQLFNRGKLSNVGIYWALKELDPDCICVHDVDLLPFPGISYLECEESYHLPEVFSHLKWTEKYPFYFGGAVTMSPNLWIKTNGFSNAYWGWGKEDDDLWFRVRREVKVNSDIPRHQEITEFVNIHFEKFGDKKAPVGERNTHLIMAMGRDKTRMHRRDGLNSLISNVTWKRTYKYSRVVDSEPPFLMVTEIKVLI